MAFNSPKTTQPRILYIIGQLARGGAEQQFFYLLKYLRPSGKIITLQSGGYWVEPIRELGYEVIELQRRGRADIRRLLHLMREMREYKPDIVHLFTDNVYGLYGRTAALLTCQQRVIVGERTHPTFDPKWYIQLQALVLNRAVNYIVANSLQAWHYLLGPMRTPSHKALHIPNGLDIERIREEAQNQAPLPEEWRESVVVGNVGSLLPLKAPDIFLEVATRVLHQRPEARFLWVGGGELLQNLRQQCISKGLQEKVLFVGTKTDVPRWLSSMDIFLMTSRLEGTPNALMEAMAVGLPAVVTAAGDCSELVIEGRSGFVSSIDSVEALTTKVIQLIDNPDLRLEMTRYTKQHITSYDVHRMAARYGALYDKLMSSQ